MSTEIQNNETIVAETIVPEIVIKTTKPKAVKKLIKKTEETKAEPIVIDEPEPMTIEEELAELDRIEKETANKKKQLLLKQQFKSQSFKTGFIDFTINDLRNMNDKFQKEIENKKNAIAIYKQHIVDAEEEIAEAEKAIDINIDKIAIIKNMNTETDFETEIKEQDLDNEISDYLLHLEKQTEAIAKQIKTPSVKKPSVKKPTKTIKKKDNETSSTTSSSSLNPEERWNLIEVGSQFRSKHKTTTRYYIKTEDGVAECDKNKNIIGETYEGIQAAANAFRIVAEIPYHISGWEFLQLYNNVTNKAISLKGWKGQPEWIKW